MSNIPPPRPGYTRDVPRPETQADPIVVNWWAILGLVVGAVTWTPITILLWRWAL